MPTLRQPGCTSFRHLQKQREVMSDEPRSTKDLPCCALVRQPTRKNEVSNETDDKRGFTVRSDGKWFERGTGRAGCQGLARRGVEQPPVNL